jgi:hypothetical protein
MLKDRLLSRRGPFRFYGISPPKSGTTPERRAEIAAIQTGRINLLGSDGVIVYDIRNEPGRSGGQRPFPFLPTVDPLAYARGDLAGIGAPKIIYKSVDGETEAGFENWMRLFAANTGGDLAVLVGAPTRRAEAESFGLREASRRAAAGYPAQCFGGVAITERHLAKGNEQDRLFSKHGAGCRFFVSQTVYDVEATKSLITDYAARFAAADIAPPPLIFSFAPCGSLKTMEFMQWLGIRFPGWLQDDLRNSRDILDRSIAVSAEVGEELAAFARAKGVRAGMNVESVSVRKEEIDASCALFQKLAKGAFRPDAA